MKRIIFGLIVLVMAQFAYGQNQSEWVSIGEKDGLQFSYTIVNCDGLPYVAIKISNVGGMDISAELYEVEISEGGFDYIHVIDLEDLDKNNNEWIGVCGQDELIYSIMDENDVNVRLKLSDEN